MNLLLSDPAFLSVAAGVTPTDPYFSNVSLLLHGDGTNGSTTIVDSSSNNFSLTAAGNAQISTAIADPFGNYTGVLAFDGTTGGQVTAPSNTAFSFGTGDFTVEAWIYRNATGTFAIFGNGPTNPGSFGFYILSDLVRIDYYFGTSLSGTTSLGLSSWHHVAVAKSGSNISLYLNGNVENTTTTSSNNTSSLLAVGTVWTNTSNNNNGYIDEFRITKGVARYETGTGANAGKMVFTGTNTLALPTAPFPNA